MLSFSTRSRLRWSSLSAFFELWLIFTIHHAAGKLVQDEKALYKMKKHRSQKKFTEHGGDVHDRAFKIAKLAVAKAKMHQQNYGAMLPT